MNKLKIAIVAVAVPMVTLMILGQFWEVCSSISIILLGVLAVLGAILITLGMRKRKAEYLNDNFNYTLEQQKIREKTYKSKRRDNIIMVIMFYGMAICCVWSAIVSFF